MAVENKSERRPLIDPLLMALKSRRVLIAISALLVGLLVMAIPDLASLRGEILTLVITLALGVIGGYSIEDAATAARQTPATDAQVHEQVKLVLMALIDEVTENLPSDSTP